MEVYLDSPAKLALESPISTIPPKQTFMPKACTISIVFMQLNIVRIETIFL